MSADPHPTGVEVDVNECSDEKRDIRYIGKASEMSDGTWRCLANVGGALCLVEVKIAFAEGSTR